MVRVNRRNFIKYLGLIGGSSLITSFNKENRITQNDDFIFIDGLSFIPEELDELKQSGLTAGIFDVSAGEIIGGNFTRTFKACKNSMNSARKLIKKNDKKVVLGASSKSIEEARATERTAIFLQLQGGGEALEGESENLTFFHNLGLRVFQMTHHYDNDFAGGSLVKNPKGLSPKGEELLEKLNTLKIITDLSHSSDLTARDTLEKSKLPVIISHGACRKFVNHPRCTPDDVIKKVGNKGGVMGVFMMSFWLTTDPSPSIDHYIQHIKHIRNIAGIESVAIANDFKVSGEKTFDGRVDNESLVAGYLTWWNRQKVVGIYGFENEPRHVVIPALNTINRLYRIREALLKNGFTNSEVDMTMGKNWLRVVNAHLG